VTGWSTNSHHARLGQSLATLEKKHQQQVDKPHGVENTPFITLQSLLYGFRQL
jgi:hypothetical protein